MPHDCICGGRLRHAWSTPLAFCVKCDKCGRRYKQRKRQAKGEKTEVTLPNHLVQALEARATQLGWTLERLIAAGLVLGITDPNFKKEVK